MREIPTELIRPERSCWAGGMEKPRVQAFQAGVLSGRHAANGTWLPPPVVTQLPLSWCSWAGPALRMAVAQPQGQRQQEPTPLRLGPDRPVTPEML